MKCADVRAMAESYLAGELPVDTNHAILMHLERCEACRAELEAREAVRETLRRAFRTSSALAPDPRFVARVAEIARQPRVARWHVGGRTGWLALAAGIALVVFVGWQLVGLRRQGVVPAAVSALAAHAAGDHRYCALEHALEERPISLEEAARRYDPAYGALRTVVAESPVAQAGDIEVVGAHWCVYQGRRFAHVVVRRKEHLASILLTPLEGQTAGRTPVAACPVAGGFQLACFGTRGHAGFVVSDLTEDDNLALARELAPVLQTYFARG